MEKNHMRTVTIQRPVVDLKATGAQIKSLRIKSGYTVHDIQAVFGFEYPQAAIQYTGMLRVYDFMAAAPS